MLVELALALTLGTGPKAAPCSEIPWRKGVEQREQMIRCLSRVFPRVDYDMALAVARCESGPSLNPRDEYHGSLGMWQHQGWLWRARAMKYLSNPRWGLNPRTVSPYNAYASTVVTFQMVVDREIGWGPWSCYR